SKSISPLPRRPLPPAPQKREDVRREREEISCLVRFLFVPEARRDKIWGKDFFYRLPSTVYPPSGDLSPRPSLLKERGCKAGRRHAGQLKSLCSIGHCFSGTFANPVDPPITIPPFFKKGARGWVSARIRADENAFCENIFLGALGEFGIFEIRITHLDKT
ncbi:MAG: hypothetical protein J4F39_18560, partial [Candidatus Latescibacteria bacterium]|nr:hypothetical protein [Candidatus Latescibacterota bacterium]